MGEAARQPDAPNFPSTPLELLTPRPGEGFTWLQLNKAPLLFALAGALTMSTYNAFKKRPFWSGIHLHILVTATLYGIGRVGTNIRKDAMAEKEAILKHYISLHPDDFPPYDKTRFKDLFLPWNPIR